MLIALFIRSEHLPYGYLCFVFCFFIWFVFSYGSLWLLVALRLHAVVFPNHLKPDWR